MNREVHYIFSIQTRDYLKSARERGRRVYLMISTIAQCRAVASGNFRKAVARGDRTAASCLSNLQNTKGLIKRKARNNNNYDLIGAGGAYTFELSTKTLTCNQPYKFYVLSTHFAFSMSYMQSSAEWNMQHAIFD